MSAVPAPPAHDLEVSLRPMNVTHLEAVLEIERAAYPFPWTRGNFVDSLAAGYLARRLVGEHDGSLRGYLVAMGGVDEMHLLNLTVAPGWQRLGYARLMLDVLVAECRLRRAPQLWLEVRPSNERARAVYERYGFRVAGLRKGYYPAALGRREDALVMSLAIGDGADDGAADGLD